MKKWMIFVLTAALVLCLAACGNAADKPAGDTATTTAGNTTTTAGDVTDGTTTDAGASATTTTTLIYPEDEGVFNDAELSWD